MFAGQERRRLPKQAVTTPVDDPTTVVTLDEILKENSTCCREARFWNISRAIMHAAALSIAMFWVDLWTDFVKGKE